MDNLLARQICDPHFLGFATVAIFIPFAEGVGPFIQTDWTDPLDAAVVDRWLYGGSLSTNQPLSSLVCSVEPRFLDRASVRRHGPFCKVIWNVVELDICPWKRRVLTLHSGVNRFAARLEELYLLTRRAEDPV